jgi:hypothetical protein
VGVDVTALQAKKSDTLAILLQESVWICDTGASTHVKWTNKCKRNVCNTQMLSLRYTNRAIYSTIMINIPGVFMTKDGNMGLRPVLKECSYNKDHNFNLLHMSMLLH